MSHGIDHFIWGYQEYFRKSVEMGASRVLESIKPGLNTKAFLIAVRIKAAQGGHAACVEPELNHWAKSEEFYNILEDVPAIQKSYPESQLRHSHPIAQANANRSLFHRALRDAVTRRLEASPSLPDDTKVFSSFPIERDGFLVMTIITVKKSVFNLIPNIESDTIAIHEYRSFRVPRSLGEAAIMHLHAKFNDLIIRPDAGADFLLGSTDNVLVQAASYFFGGLLKRFDRDGLTGSADEVFDILTRLSLAPYERAEADGCLFFSDKSITPGEVVLRLETPVPLGEERTLRKLLVLSNKDVVIHCDSRFAFLLVRMSNTPDDTRLSGIAVRLISRGRWVASHGGTDLMVMSDGLPSLPQPIVDESVLARDLRRIIPSMTDASAELFGKLGTSMASSGHGGIIVIAQNAAEESVRLCSDSLPISPITLTPELAASLSEIDGALICDSSGVCHAMGAILDGLATASGDRGRGSRFNSAARYLQFNGVHTAAMVVSDDGGLDLLPRLRAPIARSELLSQLANLKQLTLSPSDPLDREKEYEIIDWFEKHAFYLTDMQCDEVNGWITICDDRYYDKNFRITRSKLKPNTTFDPERDLI